MKTDLFNFTLPSGHIATAPAHPRDASRLLVVKPQGFADRMVRELPELLRPGDLMVFNDTRVIPARLKGKRGEAGIEITLIKHLGGRKWQAYAKPGKRLKVDDKISFGNGFEVAVDAKHEDGSIEVVWNGDDWRDCLARHGKMPLPPYMRREAEASDTERYQTIYAQKEGAVAAPTAGLHFTEALTQALDARGIERAYITLHVGAGTFAPVKAEDTSNHIMHSEYAEISPQVAERINKAKAEGRRIVAVGTTSLRALEASARASGKADAMQRETDIFITPGYGFKVVDVLMTNFHLPRSTLFMLVSAFCGLEKMQAAYAHAIAQNYRFYSYGDACLLERF